MPFFYKSKGKLSAKDQSLARLENFRKEASSDSHTIPLEDLCERTGTDPVTGLSKEQARQILERNGPNALTPSRKKSEILVFIFILFDGFSPLLWAGAALCFLSVAVEHFTTDYSLDIHTFVLGFVLILVVLITGAFAYYQQRKSQGIMESFSNMVPNHATVIRGGVTSVIECKYVVLGDLVEIKFGDRVPADVRIIHCQNLKVDNSPLTGESEAQPRSNAVSEEPFLEAKNVAFFSTNVVEGVGKGIVIACGDHTVMGHIAGLTARLQPKKTPMSNELTRFMRFISVWAVSLGVIFGIACLLMGDSIVDTFLFAIGIIVANVPEGLLATVILCLTVTAKRLVMQNCLVKKLESVETLGCTSTICSDKTGTLTQNRMTAYHLWYDGTVVEADGITVEKKSQKPGETFTELIRCATLCNRAEYMEGEESKPVLDRKVRGDASEGAILKFIDSLNLLGESFRERNPKLAEIPFNSTNKYQISVHAMESGKCLVTMKGAPEVVLEHCSHILHHNETEPLDGRMLKICNEACVNFAEMGERVLGFCDLLLDETYGVKFPFTTEPANFPQRGLRFLGLMAMIDPPRPQVPDAIRKCKEAGIKVAMVTGDHPITAKAIAVKVGIITNEVIHEFIDIKSVQNFGSSIGINGAVVLHGAVLKDLSPEDFDRLLDHHSEIVFARTSPTQKLQIVEGFQRLGEIVAVTGDGVNDAPALKRADTGIAMGITGTEVSQQAADIILMDDNFATIVTGVEEGRRIFDNLKKSITYTLTSNVPQIVPFLAHSFVGIPLPLGIVAILCIDILTDMMPAISIAYERAERDIMTRPPRNPLRDRLVSRKLYFLAYGNLGFLEALNVFLVYFLVMAEHGFLPNSLIGIRNDWEADKTLQDSYGRNWNVSDREILENTCNTACMMSVVVSQWANIFACKTRINSLFDQGIKNTILIVSLFVESILTCILAYCPYMYYISFFPISYRWWFYAMPFAVILLMYDEFRKWHIRNYPKGWFQRETFY